MLEAYVVVVGLRESETIVYVNVWQQSVYVQVNGLIPKI